jgi:transaldolase
MNTVQQLLTAGQSIWYDNIQRKLLQNGELAGMIDRGEIRGVTSNPTIFMNAITKSQDYDQSLLPLAGSGLSDEEIFFSLAIEDIQSAADLFRPLYRQSHAGDGYVSLEVSPFLANDSERTLEQVQKLWQRVNGQPDDQNPATREGLRRSPRLIALGINVKCHPHLLSRTLSDSPWMPT